MRSFIGSAGERKWNRSLPQPEKAASLEGFQSEEKGAVAILLQPLCLVRFRSYNHQQSWWNKKALALRNLLCYNRSGLATASKAKEVCHRR
ncbi:MAG: hypothetical protein ACOX55_01560 [Christensenellales bacterium]|jgi:hypothetical protein